VFFALCLPFDFSSQKVIRREDNPIFPSLDLGLQYLSSHKKQQQHPVVLRFKKYHKLTIQQNLMFSVAQSSNIVGTTQKVVVHKAKKVKSSSKSILRCSAQKEETEEKRSSSSLQQAAVATVLSVSMLAQPAFAASEIAQFAAGDSKAAADALLAEYTQKRAIVQQAPKTKSLAKGGKKAKKEAAAPKESGGGFSLPSFSLPSLPSPGAGKEKAAPAAKAAPAPAAAKEGGSGKLIAVCLVLFSPLVLVQVESFKTLARLAKQKAGN